MTSASRPFLQVAGVLAVAALSVLSWYAWLGWDHEYQTDPVTQVTSGPYETWQVVGCVLSLLVILVGALLIGLRPLPVSAAMTLAFTIAWTVDAAASDETGLYGVGTLMLLFGLAAATTVVSVVTLSLRGALKRRRHVTPAL